MDKSLLSVRLILAEASKDGRIGALAVELDLSIGSADDGRHALSCTVKLADVQDLKFLLHSADVDKNRARLSSLEGHKGGKSSVRA